MRQARQPIIIANLYYWKCSSCGELFTRDNFYKDKRNPNGLKSQCKKCHSLGNIKSRDLNNTRRINRKHMRRARQKDPNKFRQREKIASRLRLKDEKYRARMILNIAVRGEKLLKPKICEKCGKKLKLTAHHEDYTKPLDVKWLCYECH